jgi:hypothetical protein
MVYPKGISKVYVPIKIVKWGGVKCSSLSLSIHILPRLSENYYTLLPPTIINQYCGLNSP